MEVEIDESSAEAVYEQIVRQVRQGVQLGTLLPGAALPSIRQFADDLDLNPNTVAKAYKILETQRVIRTAGRKGTFVTADAISQINSLGQQDALYAMTDLVRSLRERGLSAEQIQTSFATALAAAFPDLEQ